MNHGDNDKAFYHYAKGNAAARRKFNVGAFHQKVKDLLYVYSQERVALKAPESHQNQQSIFIVGMPRSGSSLLEQIIASHREAFGAGELKDMNDIAGMTTQLSGKTVAYPNCIPDLTGPQVNQLREEYSRRINRVAKVEYKRVIDKHPLNFIYVGLIFMLFPGAKVIHTIRNPLDTCLSCFFQNFTNGQSYIFDLNTLAHFYNDYKRLMSHWNQIFDGRILNVEYEGLLADQRNETDRVLEYCGLDFEEGCLRFYETERTVKTASFKQVRKPIHQESKHRWKNYIPHLQNLAEMIGESIPNSQPLR